MDISTSKKRGGARMGAGRKSLNRKAITVMMEISLLDRMSDVCKNRSRFINDAIREKLERDSTTYKRADKF